jgi:Tol biopolymer transport system component
MSFTLALLAALCLAPLAAQDVQVELQRAIQKEVATGDLKAAIADYQAIVRRAGASKAVAAQALVRMADAHRKLGQAEATRIYERVLRDYADQTEAAAHARAALAGSRVSPAVSTGLALRRVWTGDIDGLGSPSADGRVVSFTDWQTGDLAIRDLATNTTRRLTNTGGFDVSGDFAEFSVPSPDGSQVAYAWWSERGPRPDTYDLRLVTIGGKARVLHASAELEWIQPLQWTANGRALIATRELKGERHDIVRIALADGAVRVLKSLGTNNVDRAALSPDDRYLAYAAAPGSRRNNRDIHVLDLQTNTETPASVGASDDGDVYWSPDGSSLIFRSDRTGSVSLWRLPMQNGKPSGAAERLSTEITTHILGVTGAGSVFFVRRGDRRNVYLADVDEEGRLQGKPAVLSERHLDLNHSAEWSPDGRWVAFYSSRGSNARGQGASFVVVRDMQTGTQRELPLALEAAPGPATGLRWFTDGESLLVVIREPVEGPQASPRNLAYARLHVATGKVEVLYRQASGRFLGNRPGLSVDGSTLFFIEGAASTGPANATVNRLIRLDLAGGRQTELKSGWSGSLALSPDGKQLAYLGGTERRAEKFHVAVLPVNGGSPTVLFESTWDAQARVGTLGWTRDGRHLLFARREKPGGPQMLWRLAATGGAPTATGIETKGQIKAPSASPDGKRLLYTVAESDPSELWVMENLLRSPSPKK